MDTNKNGRSVPNDMCVLCAESKDDVSYEEHARHVDFIAARGRAMGYHTEGPPPEQWASEYAARRRR